MVSGAAAPFAVPASGTVIGRVIVRVIRVNHDTRNRDLNAHAGICRVADYRQRQCDSGREKKLVNSAMNVSHFHILRGFLKSSSIAIINPIGREIFQLIPLALFSSPGSLSVR
jgi:hypothetical protein